MNVKSCIVIHSCFLSRWTAALIVDGKVTERLGGSYPSVHAAKIDARNIWGDLEITLKV